MAQAALLGASGFCAYTGMALKVVSCGNVTNSTGTVMHVAAHSDGNGMLGLFRSARDTRRDFWWSLGEYWSIFGLRRYQSLNDQLFGVDMPAQRFGETPQEMPRRLDSGGIFLDPSQFREGDYGSG